MFGNKCRCQDGACLHWFLLLIPDMLDITHTDATQRLHRFLIGWLVAWPDSDWSKFSHCEDCSWCQWLVSETRSHCRSLVDVEFEFSLTPRMNRRQKKKCSSKSHSSVWYRWVFGHKFVIKKEFLTWKYTMFAKHYGVKATFLRGIWAWLTLKLLSHGPPSNHTKYNF